MRSFSRSEGLRSVVGGDETAVLLREFDRSYPIVERAAGVWLYGPAGERYLDAVGGGAMVATLGHGVPEIVEALHTQAQRVSYVYNQQFTTQRTQRRRSRFMANYPAPQTGQIRKGLHVHELRSDHRSLVRRLLGLRARTRGHARNYSELHPVTRLKIIAGCA